MGNATGMIVPWILFFCVSGLATSVTHSSPQSFIETPPKRSCHSGNSATQADCTPGAAHVTNSQVTRSEPILTKRSSWPNQFNTGMPIRVTLSPYEGPCKIIDAKTIIDSKLVDCDLIIQAADVLIVRSKINGYIRSEKSASKRYSFTLEDSEVDASPNGARAVTAVGEVNFVVRRSNIHGGNRTAHCWQNCLIEDSWLHGQDTDHSGVWHESAVRMGKNAIIRRNTLVCDAPDVPPDAGCSASLTGYGDFAPVQNNIIEGNWFPGTTGGFCAYGGSSVGKPYSKLASNIVFKDNVFGMGNSGKCGIWGPIIDFDATRPGNRWINNVWENGHKIHVP